MADDGGVAGALGHLDGFEGLGQRADLVDLDQDRVGDASLDAFLEDLRVGDVQVVAHQLDLLAQHVGQVLPAVPVAFVHAVLDRDDRVLVDPAREHGRPFLRRQLQAFALEVVLAVLVELAGRAVEADRDLLAGGVAGLLDGFEQQLDRRLVARHAGGEAALVADGRGDAAFAQDLLERMEHLGAVAHRFAERGRPDRQDHEFLDVEVVVGMLAAVDHVDHRHGHLHLAHAAEVAVQR